MKRYVPIPQQEGVELAQRLAGKSLEQVIAMFGPPVQERDASRFETRVAGPPIEITRYTRVLEFSDVSPSVRSLLVLVREQDGKLEFQFRGSELPQPQS
jgi:hypothetical protein